MNHRRVGRRTLEVSEIGFDGYGRAELRVGRFLRGVAPDDYVLSTKVGRWLRPLGESS